ncbi:MAG: hypothetical protein L0323_19085 [Planctomycetes bacterium]|nr:hypothetical protein [Planctomycetota bacterium]
MIVVLLKGPRAWATAKSLEKSGLVPTSLEVEVRLRCHSLYALVTAQGVLPWRHFEEKLDEKTELFENLSPRDAYDNFRDFMEACHGGSMLGIWGVRRLRRHLAQCRDQRMIAPPGFAVAGVDVEQWSVPFRDHFGDKVHGPLECSGDSDEAALALVLAAVPQLKVMGK